jgi:hypothetical protein
VRASDSEWTFYAEGSYMGSGKARQEQLVSDLIFVSLGVFLFVLMGIYARVCARL